LRKVIKNTEDGVEKELLHT